MADNGSRANIPELDGIRGLAILAVIVFHAGTLRSWNVHPLVLDIAGFGWAGVDLFFVLSGFLITGILLDVRGTGGALRNFYARRVLRIFPLYYTALLLYFHLLPAAARAFSLLQGFVRTEEAWYWLYLSNLSPSAGTAHPQLTHFWSPRSKSSSTWCGRSWCCA